MAGRIVTREDHEGYQRCDLCSTRGILVTASDGQWVCEECAFEADISDQYGDDFFDEAYDYGDPD